ncbi:MAG: marine proteobacterial sortase target protein, partial [Xanthomonadales bacterium]|nr:marine proteobacterial sortase target protein [Xanthomonadales bacterium]
MTVSRLRPSRAAVPAGNNRRMEARPPIRDWLEHDARRNHPQLARRLSRRKGRSLRRKPLAIQDRVLLSLSALLLLLLAVGVETARADQNADSRWGMVFKDQGSTQRRVAIDSRVEVEVTGMIARFHVAQRFRNTGRRWAEAVYRFPLPEGAAVDRLHIQAGQRVIEGEIREKTDARRQYQAARSQGQIASLVEQQRPNQFETRLANIGPDEEILVTISFLAPVDYRQGRFALHLPLTFTPRWRPESPRATGHDEAPSPVMLPPARVGETATGALDDHFLTIDVDLRPGLELAGIESRFHEIDLHPTLHGYRVFLADPDTRTDRVFELNWTPAFGASPEAALMSYDDGDAVYAMLMLAPPLAETLVPRPREVVLLIDTSGSMAGESLRQAKAALRRALTFLEPGDLFNVIEFNSDSESLFEASVAAEPGYLLLAEDFIDGLRADGGTHMAPALESAMGMPSQQGLLRQIVFVTDGSVGNEAELLLLLADELGASRLFTVSIGSAPNSWFMRKAAVIGRGSHTHIGRRADVAASMAELWRRIKNPAVTDVCVDWGMEAEFYPEIVPDLYAGEPLWLLARLPREPVEVSVCGELDGAPWEIHSRPVAATGGQDLALLWARSKVEALEDSRL